MSDENNHSSPSATEGTSPESGASVDRIRDILFGAQIKNYEARFARLEDNLVRETVELKETMRRRFESLEGFFRSETEALAARLRAEREERTGAVQSVDHDLKAAHAELGRRIHELDAATAETASNLRNQLMAESRKLLDEIGERHDSLRALLERRVAELRHGKTDRAVLSALFSEFATQLGDEKSSEQQHHQENGHGS